MLYKKCPVCGNHFTMMKPADCTMPEIKWNTWADKHYIVCPDCAANHSVQITSIQRGIDALRLPTLTGSEKQIAWATDIRQKFVEASREHLLWVIVKSPAGYTAQYLSRAGEILAKQTYAGWWIDNRYRDAYAIMRDGLK